ncbi:MAG: radical SAM protein [Acidobacteria bacterium]|nr:radical SAM protein [Acidobacteriota bacterium]
MASPTGCSRIIQIHPTRRCNLRCLHCYSSSGPEERDELAPALLRAALTDAAEAGYNVASFSGGEPLLYTHLREVLDHAHVCGMLTTVTTNGMLLDRRRLRMLDGGADLVAVSLDGKPESHNTIRASKRAFDAMASHLDALRATGIPFGFIFTLTQYNLDELEWVADFALEQGARLLQIHPLEDVGRAQRKMPGERPDAVESAYAYIEALRTQELAGGRMTVQIDLLDRESLEVNASRLFADELREDAQSCPFSELVSPLVIEPDGAVVPIHYGFAREYGLGDLQEASLGELMKRWRLERLNQFRGLCRRVFDEASAQTGLPFFNWYETLGETAARGSSQSTV